MYFAKRQTKLLGLIHIDLVELRIPFFNDFYVKEGIIHEVTPPYSPKSNGVVERKNRTLKEMMNAMPISSNAPDNL